MTNAPLGVVLHHLRTLVQAESYAAETDGRLLERFTACRDEGAFALLLSRHGPMVLGVCRRVLRRVQDAEDVFQATFLLFARKASSIRKQEAVGSWLHGVAYRLAVAAKTQTLRRQTHERRAATMRKTDHRAEATWQELQAVLDEGLRRLPEKYRTALVLSYLEGKTHEEAAGQLGCPLATFRNWVARGRKLLRTRLVRRGLSLSTGTLAAALTENAAPGAVPATLLNPTLRSALQFAAGTEATALVALPVAALVETGLKALLVAKLKFTAVLLLTVGLLIAAASYGAHHGLFANATDEGPAKPAKTETVDRPPGEGPGEVRTDPFGDPLPEGAIQRLGTLRFRQGGGVIDQLLLTPDGKTLISKSYYGGRTVCVWEFATGKLVRQFPGHYEENRAVALSPDGKELAIGQDAVIHFYELASGRELRQFASPLGGTEGLAYSPDGRMLASGHERQTVILWDLTSTGRELARLAAEHNRVTLLAFSPDGRMLVTSDTLDKRIRLFDVAARKERQLLIRAVDLHDWVYAHTAFAFSPNGSTLAVGVQGGALIPLLEVATGKVIRELRGAGKYIRTVTWSPDGKTLAASYHDTKSDGDSIHLWDAATGAQRRPIPTQREVVQSLTFTPDGRTLVSGGGNSIIRLWDPATGQERAPAQGLRAPIGCMAQTPDGRTLAFNDGDIRLWDRTAGREAGMIPGHHMPFAFAPDGKTLAGLGDGVTLWDVAGRRLVRRLQSDPKREDGHPYDSYSYVAFSPDGQLLACAGGVSRTRRGVNVTDDAVVQLWDAATGKKLRRLGMKERADDFCTVDAVAFAPDGKKLLASGQTHSSNSPFSRSKVRVWEVATGQYLARLSAALNEASDDEPAPSAMLQTPYVYPRIVGSPDGKMLAMNRAQRTIPVWEAATGHRRLLLEGHEEVTVFVAFSPDGRTLASSGWDNTLRLWDLETGKELRKLTGHRGKAASLVFSVDGKTLISAGDDTTVLFWDVAAVAQRPRGRAARLATDERDALWKDLAGTDAAKAHRALTTLSANPEQAVAFLQERLRPARAIDTEHIAQLIMDLDSRSFAAREKAVRELEALGDRAEPALRRALKRQPSLESRRRAEQVLDKLAVPSGEPLRALRAVEVLEHIGTPGAKQVLGALSRGAKEARLTQEAKGSLERLTKRPSATP